MATIYQWYFKQPIQHGELQNAFGALQASDQAIVNDLGYFGVVRGGGVVQHAAIANLTVDVAAGTVYDQTGERVAWPTTNTVDVSQDSNAVSTTVVTGGNERWVSVFAQFVRVLSDPRVDGNSITLQFQQAEGFKFIVMQGAEATIGTAARPALQSNMVLLADINLVHGTTAVLNAAISISRRQDAIVVIGSPNSLRRGLVTDALADIIAIINAIPGSSGSIDLTHTNFLGGVAWADGVTNPAATGEAEVEKIISDLAIGNGLNKIHAPAVAGSYLTLAAGTAQSQIAHLQSQADNPYRLLDRHFFGGASAPQGGSVGGTLNAFATDATYNTAHAYALWALTLASPLALNDVLEVNFCLQFAGAAVGAYGAKIMIGIGGSPSPQSFASFHDPITQWDVRTGSSGVVTQLVGTEEVIGGSYTPPISQVTFYVLLTSPGGANLDDATRGSLKVWRPTA